MADVATSVRIQQSARMKALVLPREHGAWGLLLIPLVAGACIGIPFGHGVSDLLLFIVAVMSLFLLRTPLESYFGMGLMRATTPEEKKRVLQAIAVFLPFVVVSVGGLLWGGRNTALVLIGCVAGTVFGIQAVLKLFGRKMRMIAQIVGSMSLTSTAAGAYYVVAGKLDMRALAVWFACFLFAGDQIHYVQLRMRNVRVQGWAQRASVGRNFLLGQVVMLTILAVASYQGLLPALAIAAFAPVIFRGVFWLVDEEAAIDVQWLGVTELLQGITFCVLLTATFFIHQ